MPDKVAFVSSAYLITAVTRKPLYLPLQQRLLLAENETAFANMWETLVSVNKHKQKFIFECKGHIIKKKIYIYIYICYVFPVRTFDIDKNSDLDLWMDLTHRHITHP